MSHVPSRSLALLLSALLCAATTACGDSPTSGADAAPDAATGDAAADTSSPETGAEVSVDTGTDAALPDGGSADAGTDATGSDAPDGSADANPDLGPFMAILPCPTAAAYVTTPRVVSTGANVYEPACLRVPAGASVQIEASAVHPVEARAGGSSGNPITNQLGTTTVTFPTPGFYPFLCPEHVDQGMIGVIWVTP